MPGWKNGRFPFCVLVAVILTASFLFVLDSSQPAGSNTFVRRSIGSWRATPRHQRRDENAAPNPNLADWLAAAGLAGNVNNAVDGGTTDAPVEPPVGDANVNEPQGDGTPGDGTPGVDLNGDLPPGDFQLDQPPAEEVKDGDLPATATEEEPPEETRPDFMPDKWHFQADLGDVTLPKFNVSSFRNKYRNHPPHNYEGPGHEAFAVFYTTRNGTDRDPYFLAAQNIVYRLLWAPATKSKHPIVIFVTSFISQEQRDWFTAAGAMVREVGLMPFTPLNPGIPGRLQDMFSKLEMWKQTDFKRLTYLDSDAFPFTNIDDIFNITPEQRCNTSLITPDEWPYASELCSYVFAGHTENTGMINAGVFVLKPDRAMHARLVRQLSQKDSFDNGFMEQSMLSKAFHPEGAFPHHELPPAWNAFSDYPDKGIPIYILHDKMWSHYFGDSLWVTQKWDKDWTEMLAFYNSEQFETLREEDRNLTATKLNAMRAPGRPKKSGKPKGGKSKPKRPS